MFSKIICLFKGHKYEEVEEGLSYILYKCVNCGHEETIIPPRLFEFIY